MTCLLMMAAGIGISAAEDENVVYTRERAFRIPLELSDAERKEAAWIRLMVSTDAGKTWNHVREESPKRPTVTFRAPSDGQYWLALAVVGQDQKVHPSDPAELKPGLKVVIDSTKPEVALEAVKTRSGLRGVRWTTKDGSPEDKLTLKCAVWDDKVKTWKPRSLEETRNRTIWFGRNEEIGKMQLLVCDAAGNEAVEQIDIDGDRFQCSSQGAFALAPKAPSPRQFAENAKQSDEPRSPSKPAVKDLFADASPLPNAKSTTEKPAATLQQVSAKGDSPTIQNAVAEGPQKPQSMDAAAMPATSTKAETHVAAKPVKKDLAADSDVDVTYSNRRTTILHYEMTSVPKGQAVELWGEKGKVWICLGRDEDGVSPMEALFPDDGRWGVTLVVGDEHGSGRPAPNDAPAMWVEIDTKPPKVELKSARFENNQVRLAWKAADPSLVEDSVRILCASDVQGPWETIAVQQTNEGEYVWNASKEAAAKPMYFRLDATDRAGNIGSTTTPKPLQKGDAAHESETSGVDAAPAKTEKKPTDSVPAKTK